MSKRKINERNAEPKAATQPKASSSAKPGPKLKGENKAPASMLQLGLSSFFKK
jgi:hypothetical protein